MSLLRNLISITLFLLLLPFAVSAQHLDFIGLKGISFGMKSSAMNDKTVILDSTSSYKDTATYVRNTRCQMYFRKTQELQLTGFVASRIEYEFCDNELTYVFIYVNGNSEIDKALAELKKTFKGLGCKGKDDPKDCERLDDSAKGMRCIVNIDRKKQSMNFVLISKKPR